MRYLNLETSRLHSEEYIACEPIARATWLNVLLWCCEQENGGRIIGAKAWGDRRWQQTCGVTLQEVKDASPLLTWQGDDLVIWAYPTEKETEVKTKREAGRVGGIKSAQRRSLTTSPNNSEGVCPPKSPAHAPETAENPVLQTPQPKDVGSSAQAQLEAQLEGELQRKEMLQRKGKEGNIIQYKPTPLPPPLEKGGESLPALPFSSPEFVAAWRDWTSHRRERRLSAYRPTAAKALFDKLRKWGHDNAIESIRESIANNWQGLFEPKAKAKPTPRESIRVNIG